MCDNPKTRSKKCWGKMARTEQAEPVLKMRSLVILVAAILIPFLFTYDVKAACGSGWTLELVRAEPAELFFVQGASAVKTTILTMRTVYSPGTKVCGLVAWSKMPGVKVNLTSPAGSSNPPGEIDGGSWDWFHPGPREQMLDIHVSSDAKEGDGVVEIRQATSEFDPKVGFVIGTIKVHIKPPAPPDLCLVPPQQRFAWTFGEVPSGLLNHMRDLPDEIVEGLEPLQVQMDFVSESSLPSDLTFTLDLNNHQGLLIGSAPDMSADHQILFVLLDPQGCKRGELYVTIPVRPQPEEPLSVSVAATANQVCGPQFSHELRVSWRVSGVRVSTEVKIEITGPDGQVETLGTETLEGSRRFSLAYPGGGSVNIKVTAQDTAGSSSSTQSSVQLGACR